MDTNFPPFVAEKKPKPGKNVTVPAKKVSKTPRSQIFMKLSGFTRAETHLGIARFISERLKRN